jgi:hypothetical protein
VCLSDPQQAGLFLKGWALDEGRPVPQRTFSIWVLSGMGLAGLDSALDRLKEIGRGCRSPEIKAMAIGHLSLVTADADTHRLIMQVLPSVDLSNWANFALLTYDPEKVSLIRTKVAQAGNPAAWINERVERLSTPGGRQKMLQAAGTYSPDISAVLQQWEMDAAWVNRLPGLKEALRKRMDDQWVEAQAHYRSLKEKGRLEDPSPVEEQYARGTGGAAIVDELHDDALLYYWRLGGELKEREWKRLQYHGFVGDQSAHLREILPGR